MAKKTDSSFKWSITNKMLAQAMVSADNEDSGEEQGEEDKNVAGESKTSFVKFLEHSEIVELAKKSQPAV